MLFFLYFLWFFVIDAFEYCSNFEFRMNHSYFPLRHCQRSNASIIGLRNVKVLDECVSFAKARAALAFNYGDKKRGTENRFDTLMTNNSWSWDPEEVSQRKSHETSENFYNCQLLECPEFGNFTGMINDTRFDYYSLYTKPPPPSDSICVPQVGMFLLHKKPSNYTFAYKTCHSLGGGLAHIVSERRTNSLASFLKENLNLTVSKEAYIGLNETILGKFNTSSNEPLDCFLFRAWAPGHPPENRRPSCIGLNIDRSWKAFNCAHKMPFLCEIFTTGPNKNVKLDRKCSVKRPNNRFVRVKETKNLNK